MLRLLVAGKADMNALTEVGWRKEGGEEGLGLGEESGMCERWVDISDQRRGLTAVAPHFISDSGNTPLLSLSPPLSSSS